MRSTLVSTFLSVTPRSGVTASLGSVTTPLIAEEEFCERTLVGARVAAKANRRQKVDGRSSPTRSAAFHDLHLIASGIGKTAEPYHLESSRPARS